MSRGIGYALQKGLPAPSPEEKVKRQRRAHGLAPEAVGIISTRRSTGPLEDWDHAGSGGRYMAHKVAKLQQQFRDTTSNSARIATADGDLFRGVSIFVNGLTRPSHAELKQIMAMHGGCFQNYYSRSSVSHIICSNLTDAKVKHFHRERHPVPIVSPEWVTDCLKEHRLLPHEGYVLQRLKGPPGQRILAAFDKADATASHPHPVHSSAAASALARSPQPLDSHDPRKSFLSTDDPVFSTNHSLRTAGPVQHGPSCETLGTREAQKQLKVQISVSETSTQQKAFESVDADKAFQPWGPSTVNEAGAAQCGREATKQATPIVEEYDMVFAQEVAAKKRAACDVLKGRPRTSRDDPDFVDTFFKASRLHFIGTWKARIEALMSELVESAPAPSSSRPSVLAALHGHSKGPERVIMHLDMDCFFASIAANGHPALAGKPLAVCHSNHAGGSAEISSCNYAARGLGIKAGMRMSTAKGLCPHLLVLPYEFDKYQKASEAVYRILLRHSAVVQPVSCDEAFVDVSGLGNPLELAAAIRAQVFTETGCTASAGLGPNMLVARLATRRAKPDGVCRIAAADAKAALSHLPLSHLPGIGWSLTQRLNELGLRITADVLHTTTKERLQRDLGNKTGSNLWDMAHARDSRVVQPPQLRKSMGAEVSWGVRFNSHEDAEAFLAKLSGEVSSRLSEAGVQGRCITLKVKRKKEGAPEPSKFLGHGICDNVSRSVTLSRFLSSPAEIAAEAQAMLRALRIPAAELRGVGVLMSRLSSDSAAAAARPTMSSLAKRQSGPASVFDPSDPHPWAASMVAAAEQEQRQRSGDPSAVTLERSHHPPQVSKPYDTTKFPARGPLSRQVDNAAPVGAAAERGVPVEPIAAALNIRPVDCNPIDPDHAAGALTVDDGSRGSFAFSRGSGSRGPRAPTAESEDDPDRDSFSFSTILPQPTARESHGDGHQQFVGFLELALQLEDDMHAEAVHTPSMLAAQSADGTFCEARHCKKPTKTRDEVLSDSRQPQRNVSSEDATATEARVSEAMANLGAPKAALEQGTHHSSCIEALPSPSQLDAAVLDSLPLAIKRELELAYGFGRERQRRRQPRLNPEAARRIGRSRGRPLLPPLQIRGFADPALPVHPPVILPKEAEKIKQNTSLRVEMKATDAGDSLPYGQIDSALQNQEEPAPKQSPSDCNSFGARQGINWAAEGVQAGTVPPGVLHFLSTASVDECCRMLTEWAADGGCPGIVAPQDPHGLTHTKLISSAANSGNWCSCPDTHSSSPFGGVAPYRGADTDCGGMIVNGTSNRALCSSHEVLRRLLVGFAADFLADLEQLQQVLRCIMRLGEQHAKLRLTAALAVQDAQNVIKKLYGARLQLLGPLS